MVIFTSLEGEVEQIASEYLEEQCLNANGRVEYFHPEKGLGYVEIDWDYYT